MYHKVVNAALWLRLAMVTYLEMVCFQCGGDRKGWGSTAFLNTLFCNGSIKSLNA